MERSLKSLQALMPRELPTPGGPGRRPCGSQPCPSPDPRSVVPPAERPDAGVGLVFVQQPAGQHGVAAAVRGGSVLTAAPFQADHGDPLCY